MTKDLFINIFVGMFVFLFITTLALLHVPMLIVYGVAAVIAFFLLVFFNTHAAFVLLIFSMLFSPEFNAGGIPGRIIAIRLDDILIGAIFFGWLAKMAVRRELGLIRVTPVNKPIMLYVVTALVATAIGILQEYLTFKTSFFFIFKYFEYFLLFFMVANNLKNVGEARSFVFFLLLTCFLVCVYAWVRLPIDPRATAPFESEGGEPNTFAGYLLLMMGVILGFIVYSDSAKKRGLHILFFIFVFIPFIFTLSRGGWLGFFAMCIVFVLINRRFRIPIMILSFALIVVVPHVMPDKVHERVAETFTSYRSYDLLGKKINVSESASARIESWSIGIKKWSKKPIFGYGVPSGGIIDNQYMRVLTETGVVGLFAFLWMIWRVLKSGITNFRDAKDDNFSKALNIGFVAGLIGLLVQSMGAAVFIIIRIMEPFWFIAALIVMLPYLKREKDEQLVTQ